MVTGMTEHKCFECGWESMWKFSKGKYKGEYICGDCIVSLLKEKRIQLSDVDAIQ